MAPEMNQGPPCEVVFHCRHCNTASTPVVVTELDEHGVYILPLWAPWLTTECTSPTGLHDSIVDLQILPEWAPLSYFPPPDERSIK